MFFKKFLLILIFSTLLASCASARSFKGKPFSKKDFLVSHGIEVSKKAPLHPPKKGSFLSFSDGRLHLIYNEKHYTAWVNYFTKRAPDLFETHLANAYKVKNSVQKILSDYKIPIEVFYLGLIESGYTPKIKSRASATGHWQFMRGTALRYGLRVDNQVDERYNLYKSTEAAAKYLGDLYNIFGSWELSFCAYNAGEYRVINAIRKGGTRDYRRLVSMGLLPSETVQYIPKLVAARDIFLNPKRFGMNYKRPNGEVFEKVYAKTMKGPIKRNHLQTKYQVSQDLFELLNPDLKTPLIFSRTPMKIFLPIKNRSLASVKVKSKSL